jgi:hypothetical protein
MEATAEGLPLCRNYRSPLLAWVKDLITRMAGYGRTRKIIASSKDLISLAG